MLGGLCLPLPRPRPEQMAQPPKRCGVSGALGPSWKQGVVGSALPSEQRSAQLAMGRGLPCLWLPSPLSPRPPQKHSEGRLSRATQASSSHSGICRLPQGPHIGEEGPG